MRTEEIVIEDYMDKDSDKALGDIRDRVAMLSIASEYLCEDPFLKKIGFSIEHNIDVLRRHTDDLRKEFVGQPVGEIEVSQDLEQIAVIARLMQEPEKVLCEKCARGELGKELGSHVISLIRGVNALKERVEGKAVSYSRLDSALGIFARLRWVNDAIVMIFRSFYKVAALVVILCLAGFASLYITMETEKGLLKKIEQYRSDILSQQAALVPLGEEIRRIKKKTELIRQKALNRQAKIEAMNLELKAYGLAENREKLEFELKGLENALSEEVTKLDELKKKSFLERLLRR